MSVENQWNATKPHGLDRGFFETFNKVSNFLAQSQFPVLLNMFCEGN